MKTNTSNTASDNRRKSNPADPVKGAENGKMRELNGIIQEIERAEMDALQEIDSDFVTVNSLVEIMDLEYDKRMTLKLVNPTDVDIRKGRISLLSPLGSALVGHQVGNIVKFKAPLGEKQVRITNIVNQPVAREVLAD